MPDPSPYLLPEEPFRFILEKECKRAERYAHFFSILTVKLESSDLEDRLLPATASLIQGLIRNCDIMGSLQDKKLAVLIHYADAQNIDEIAARIRDRVQAHPLPFQQNPENQSIKIGGACFPTHASTAQDLLSVAQERARH